MLNTSIEALKTRCGPTFGTPEMVTENLKKFLSKNIRFVTTAFYFHEDLDTFSQEVLPHLK